MCSMIRENNDKHIKRLENDLRKGECHPDSDVWVELDEIIAGESEGIPDSYYPVKDFYYEEPPTGNNKITRKKVKDLLQELEDRNI